MNLLEYIDFTKKNIFNDYYDDIFYYWLDNKDLNKINDKSRNNL